MQFEESCVGFKSCRIRGGGFDQADTELEGSLGSRAGQVSGVWVQSDAQQGGTFVHMPVEQGEKGFHWISSNHGQWTMVFHLCFLVF
jgi:hypothetical protein